MINQRAKFRQLDTRVTTNQVHNTGTILRLVPVLLYHTTVSSPRPKRAGFVSIRVKRQMHKGSKIGPRFEMCGLHVSYKYIPRYFVYSYRVGLRVYF